MHYARTVIAYHGCSTERAEFILRTGQFRDSENSYDWLGKGVYFWEYGLDRAWRWAKETTLERGKQPAVVGALIQLGNCFDLMDTRATQELASWGQVFADAMKEAGVALPRNGGTLPDFKMRHLDCAIINYALERLRQKGTVYQTVRCGFTEGPPIFCDGDNECGIRMESHIQLVVRDHTCIVGVFRPRELLTEDQDL